MKKFTIEVPYETETEAVAIDFTLLCMQGKVELAMQDLEKYKAEIKDNHPELFEAECAKLTEHIKMIANRAGDLVYFVYSSRAIPDQARKKYTYKEFCAFLDHIILYFVEENMDYYIPMIISRSEIRSDLDHTDELIRDLVGCRRTEMLRERREIDKQLKDFW